MLKKAFIFFLLTTKLYSQTNCNTFELSFNGKELLSYEVYYHWGLIWANAGSAKFTIDYDQYAKKKVFHLVGEGNTYKGYDWFYKVRDKFETWADTGNLKPFRHIRNSNEGSNHVYNDNYFNYKQKQATCVKIIKDKVKKDSTTISDCTYDVLSMIYYARCINYSLYEPGAKIPISLYLDGQVYDTLYISFLGSQKIKTELGEKKCIMFSPLLIKGTIFSGGKGMTVWVTDDDKKIPVLIKTPIVVGEIQVKIKAVKN
jgi:hypothetical protein